MGAGFHGGFGSTLGSQNAEESDSVQVAEKTINSSNPSSEEALITELERNGIKFTKEDVVFITKDETGQTVWLEKGSSLAGLEHILNGDGKSPGHSADFERAFGIQRKDTPTFLKGVISNGKVVSNTLKMVKCRMGFERIYYYNGKHYVLAGIGTNGFIVSAYPIDY